MGEPETLQWQAVRICAGDLLACPFCGQAPIILRLKHSLKVQIICNNGICGVRPKTDWCSSDWQAIGNWNTRQASHGWCRCSNISSSTSGETGSALPSHCEKHPTAMIRHSWNESHYILNGLPSGEGIKSEHAYECADCGRPLAERKTES